jgi:DnaJ-class molecular chaperone
MVSKWRLCGLLTLVFERLETLGITSAASEKEIKKAFLMKAKQFHPDVNKATDAP